MKLIQPTYQICNMVDGATMLKHIEQIARTCYRSEDKISDGSAAKMIDGLIKRDHSAMLEHASISVTMTVDRGITHELVRHRMASFAQESTRYCNYSKGKFDNELTFINPFYYLEGTTEFDQWYATMKMAEHTYMLLTSHGSTPQEARSILPNSLTSVITVTANIREWRHIFALRALGATGAPHPQMQEIMLPMLRDFQQCFPVFFDDLIEVQSGMTDDELAAKLSLKAKAIANWEQQQHLRS